MTEPTGGPRSALFSFFLTSVYFEVQNFPDFTVTMVTSFFMAHFSSSDPFLPLEEEDDDDQTSSPSFDLQDDISFDKILNAEIPTTPENLSKCIMLMPSDNLILIYTIFNGERMLTSRSLKEWSKEYKKTPILEAITSLPPSTRFDLKDMFTGFNRSPFVHKDLTPILSFFRDGICSGNDDDFNYLLDHFAHIFQKPFERSNITVLLYGNQGTGKGIMYNLLAACLDPFAHSVQGFDKFHHYIKNFQSSTKLLINIDECNTVNDKNLQVLKDIITNTKTDYRLRVNSNPFPISIYFRLLIFSNNNNIIKMIPSERRYFCLNPALLKKDFYQRIAQYIYVPNTEPPVVDPEIAAEFAQFLLHRDISKYNPHATEVTTFKAGIIKNHLDQKKRVIVQFIETHKTWLQQGQDQQHRGEHTSADIFETYDKFVNQHKIPYAERDRPALGILFREFFSVHVQKKTQKKWYKLQEGLNLDILK